MIQDDAGRLSWRPLSYGARGDAAMKNIAFWLVIVFGLIAGTAVVMTYHPHHAEADCTGTGC